MSTIGTSIQVTNQDTGLAFSLPYATRVANSPGFSVSEITVTGAEEPVITEYATPQNVMLRLLSGDDVQVGTTMTGPYPFRLSGENDSMVLRLNVEGLRQITSFVCVADSVSNSLSGDFIELYDRLGFSVRAWFNFPSSAFGSVTYGAPAAADTIAVNGTVLTCVASLPGANEFSDISELTTLIDGLALILATNNGTVISIAADTAGTAGNGITLELGVGNTGTMSISGATLTGGTAASTPPTPALGGRLIPVAITENAASTAVASALQLALDADSAFIASVSASTVKVTDLNTGTRTAPSAAAATGFSAPTIIQSGAVSPIVYLKGAVALGSSQVIVSVAPN